MRPRFPSEESPLGTRPGARRASGKRIGAAAATLAAIAGVAGGAVASPASALAADTSPTAAVRVQDAVVRSGTSADSPLSAGLSGQFGQSPLAGQPGLGGPSPLAAASSQSGQSSLAALSSLSGPSPLSGESVSPAPHATPTQQATPAPQPSSTATPPANGGNSQQPGAQQPPRPRRFTFYDSVVPQAIPQGQIVATYDTGAHPIPVSAVAGRRTVIWIDTLATNPAGSNALDIEPGCASPSQAAGWVRARLTAHPNATAILYSSISEWSEIRADVASLPPWMQAHIRWWIADPTGYRHIVPGADATQWYWGNSYDISVARPSFTF